LAFWIPTGESGEFYLKDAKIQLRSSMQWMFEHRLYPDKSGLVVTFEQQEGLSVLELDNMIQCTPVAYCVLYTFFVPALISDPLVRVDQSSKTFSDFPIPPVSPKLTYQKAFV
jgi:hypothetical protein